MNETSSAKAAEDSSLLLDPEALKKMIMAEVRARGGTRAVDSKNVFQSLVKQTLQAFLEVEMEEHLGYPKYAAEGRGTGNSRNGSTSKAVRGDFGEVTIDTPRDRSGGGCNGNCVNRWTDITEFR